MDTFSNRSNTLRAARKALGDKATEGQDFEILPDGKRFAFRALKAEAKTDAGGIPAFLKRDAEKPFPEQKTSWNKPAASDKRKPAMSININDPALAEVPAAKANAESWDKIPSIKRARQRDTKKVNGAATKPGSKADQVIEMLKRPDGVTVLEASEHFGWQPHSTRARFATAPRDQGLKVTTEKVEGRGRVYRIQAA